MRFPDWMGWGSPAFIQPGRIWVRSGDRSGNGIQGNPVVSPEPSDCVAMPGGKGLDYFPCSGQIIPRRRAFWRASARVAA